jgi:hypothetical protein
LGESAVEFAQAAAIRRARNYRDRADQLLAMANVEAMSKFRYQLRSLARQYQALANDLELGVSTNGSKRRSQPKSPHQRGREPIETTVVALA